MTMPISKFPAGAGETRNFRFVLFTFSGTNPVDNKRCQPGVVAVEDENSISLMETLFANVVRTKFSRKKRPDAFSSIRPRFWIFFYRKYGLLQTAMASSGNLPAAKRCRHPVPHNSTQAVISRLLTGQPPYKCTGPRPWCFPRHHYEGRP